MARIKVFDTNTQSWVYADKSFGKDGITPVKGVDYFDGKDYVLTEADKSTIAALVVEMLGGNPFFGIVDENNNIIVSGNLPDGEYTVKYEMEDGSLINIGNLVLYEEGPVINWIEEVGYVEGKRISLSSGEERDQAGYYATGFIPVKYGQTVRIKGIDVTNINNITITSFDADKNPIFGSSERCGTTLYHAFVEKGTDEGNGVYAAVVNTAMYACFTSNVAYIRISSALITDESIVTVDQEIIDITPEAPETPTDINILTSGKYTIDLNKRCSTSSTLVDCDGMIRIAIPVDDVMDKTIRFKGFTSGLKTGGKGASWYIYNGDTRVGACMANPDDGIVWNCAGLSTDANGVSSITVNSTSFKGLASGRTLYINLAVKADVAISESDLADKILTIDQEIV